MSEATADPMKLKEEGNNNFAQGKFNEAVTCYTKGIEIDENSESLWSNRAAAYLKLGLHTEALSDAEKCISVNPVFIKGYHRKAVALKLLGQETNAYETYLVAIEKCGKDSFLKKEIKKAKKEMLKAHREKPVESVEHMILIFYYMGDLWDRLSTLAYFWNTASKEERHKIFARFLALGNTADQIKCFEVEDMHPMTTENYVANNKHENPVWINFFKTLNPKSKVAVLEGMWDLTTVEEKEAIIKDLQYFLAKPPPVPTEEEEEELAATTQVEDVTDVEPPPPPNEMD
jgi:tetratricopeptide (TPR) repeat protein